MPVTSRSPDSGQRYRVIFLPGCRTSVTNRILAHSAAARLLRGALRGGPAATNCTLTQRLSYFWLPEGLENLLSWMEGSCLISVKLRVQLLR
jgi:hypothetical protein